MSVVHIAALHYENTHHMRILRKRMRDSMNPFDIPENKFMEMYRLPVSTTNDFIEEVREVGNIFDTRKKIPLHLEAVLKFFAGGSYQRRVGCDALAFMSLQKISNCVRKHATIIAEKLSEKYIRFPQSIQEIETTKTSFLAECGFRNVIGDIDGTHTFITGL